MTEYFTAHEVLEQVAGLHSLSTLNKWANFVQKECHYTFHYEELPFVVRTRTKRMRNHRRTRLFTKEEIEKFCLVAQSIPTLGRDKALREQFDTQNMLDHCTHSELMSLLTKKIEERLLSQQEESCIQGKQLQSLQNDCQKLKKHLSQLEDRFLTIEQTSSGWFRRKR